MYRSTKTRWLLGLAAAGALYGAADASAASTCTYDPASRIASLSHSGAGASELDVEAGALTFYDGAQFGHCFSPAGTMATTNNTNSVLFTGSPGLPEDFIVSERGGQYVTSQLAPLAVQVFSGAEDTVDVVGSEGQDYIGIRGGKGTGLQGQVLLNPTLSTQGTVKLVGDPKLLRISGLGGGDQINPVWMPITTSMHLELRGGEGNDSMTGGLLGGDTLIGDAGDDVFNTSDGQPGDNITGGAGFDTAKVDGSDTAFGVEKFEKATVGKLAFQPKLARPAADGTTRIAFGWKHPTDWKRLRSITLTARDASGTIGAITMRPKARTATAHGALELAGKAAVTQKGKWARATMRVKAPAAADGLAFDVTAVDTKGRRQTEHDAGQLAPRVQG